MRERLAIVIGSVILVGSIVLAVVIHRPRVTCSYPPGSKVISRCGPPDYSMTLRAEIVIAGLIVAILIVLASYLSRRRSP